MNETYLILYVGASGVILRSYSVTRLSKRYTVYCAHACILSTAKKYCTVPSITAMHACAQYSMSGGWRRCYPKWTKSPYVLDQISFIHLNNCSEWNLSDLVRRDFLVHFASIQCHPPDILYCAHACVAVILCTGTVLMRACMHTVRRKKVLYSTEYYSDACMRAVYSIRRVTP